MTRSQIMYRAWVQFRSVKGKTTFAECLRLAWAIAKGFAYAYEIATPYGYVYGSGNSFEEVRVARIVRDKKLVASGIKPFGSHEFRVI